MTTVFIYVAFISILSMLVTFTIASMITFVKTFLPIDEKGTDDDYIHEKDTVLGHVLSCGLIYPAVYGYVWAGIWAIVYHDTKSIWMGVLC